MDQIPNTLDWTGGASMFDTPLGSISELPSDATDGSVPAPSWWDYITAPFETGVPGIPYAPGIGAAGDAVGGAVSSAATATGSAISSTFGAIPSALAGVKSVGVWIVIVLALLVVGLVVLKV